MGLRIYLDRCAWKRPYDTVVSERVRIEALAVASLLEAAADRRVELVSSVVLEAENARNPDPIRRDGVAALLSAVREVQVLSDEVVARAREVEQLGMRPLDALHVASAESAGCTHLVTTDRRLATVAARNRSALRTACVDPVAMLRAVEGEP